MQSKLDKEKEEKKKEKEKEEKEKEKERDHLWENRLTPIPKNHFKIAYMHVLAELVHKDTISQPWHGMVMMTIVPTYK